MSARVNIWYHVINSRVSVMSLPCRCLLESENLPSLPRFERAMDCSLHEISRKEQFIAPKNAFYGLIRTKKWPRFLT